MEIILLIIGFILLIKSADIFIDSATSLAQGFNVSKSFIGLTILAFGTGLPEFAIAFQSLQSGSADMVIGNVIGSNITNALLILGCAAAISPIAVKRNTIRKELPLCLMISTLLVFLFLDEQINNIGPNMISRSDALAIILFFCIFILYIVSISRKKIDEDAEEPKYSTKKSILLIVIGIVGIILGSELVVKSSISIAKMFNISERVISLTILAIGTSLPELVTTVMAAIKKEHDLLLGNILGSNIFNICIVLGVPVAVFGNLTPSTFQMLDILFLLLSSTILFVFATTSKRITKKEGVALILLYFTYYILVFSL